MYKRQVELSIINTSYQSYLLALKAKTGVVTSKKENEAWRPHTGSRPCAFFKEKQIDKKRNPAAPKTHHEIHSSPATAITSRRRATKHVPRVSSYSPVSIDPGFVEIGLVELSQSAKKRRMLHIHTDRHTDRRMDGLTK